MNWSVYSTYVGNVFGAPLAIEGLGAFFLESTFLGLWIFGWQRLSPRVHLATIWLAAAGSWLSGYFILVANSWMQHPVGSKIEHGKAVLTSVSALLTSTFALWAYGHVHLAGLSAGSAVVFGIACWHLVRSNETALFMRAAKLALIVLVPVAAVNLWFGSHFGIYTTETQPMKIAATEALWKTEQPASFSLFQIGGFSSSNPTPSFSIEVPRLLSFLATGSFSGKVVGIDEEETQEAHTYGARNYIPPVRAVYWAMRVMAYAGSLLLLVGLLGAYFYRRRSLERHRWFLWSAVCAMALPFIAALAGWVLTEVGRQPWIVYGLLRTSRAVSPNVSLATVATSLGIFVSLYVVLGIADFVLMRRYARPQATPPPEKQELQPAVGY
jgi:cytochrome d ubiquinol oxidase subunit I